MLEWIKSLFAAPAPRSVLIHMKVPSWLKLDYTQITRGSLEGGLMPIHPDNFAPLAFRMQDGTRVMPIWSKMEDLRAVMDPKLSPAEYHIAVIDDPLALIRLAEEVGATIMMDFREEDGMIFGRVIAPRE